METSDNSTDFETLSYSDPETIFALSSAPGRGGVAVIRLSGPGARDGFSCFGVDVPKPRYAALRLLRDKDGEELDSALCLWFPGPQSFTGEDVAEFHIHGGRAIIDGVISRLGAIKGFRLAEPGEFTRRAFENGKLDLTAAEGLIDLIDSETEAQRKQALRQMRGALGAKFDNWRDRIIRALAYFEAAIDFPDEELPDDVLKSVSEALETLISEISGQLNDNSAGERLREGLRMAIVGPPNAGKSSLVNWLAQRDAAIVSEIAGTTRDVVEVHLGLSGYPLVIADTAGLRESTDSIESEGIRRAKAWAEDADFRLVVLDGSQDPIVSRETSDMIDENAVVIVNKSDLMTDQSTVPDNALVISVAKGEGLDSLMTRLEEEVVASFRTVGDASITRERHRAGLHNCVEALERASAGLVDGLPLELPAEDLRLSVRALARLTGSVDVEDLLDVIFRDFCIGK